MEGLRRQAQPGLIHPVLSAESSGEPSVLQHFHKLGDGVLSDASACADHWRAWAGNPLQNTAFAPPALGTLPWTRAALRRRATSPAVPRFGTGVESWKGLRVVLARQPGWGGYVDRRNQV